MVFLLEFFLACAIIGIIVLYFRLKDSKLNADLLKQEAADFKNHLAQEKIATDLRQSELCGTIKGLEETLAKEKLELKTKEAELLKALTVTEENLEEETESRKKILSQKKSSEVRLGHIAEKLAPFLEDFTFNPEDATFLGQPIDYIVFEDEVITFVEIKSGKSQLNAKQRHIRDLVKNKCIAWKEIRIK